MGLETMGGPMCRRLAASGYAVTAYDLDAEALAAAESRDVRHMTEYVVGVAAPMYDTSVKAVTITMPEALDAEAAAEARRLGISKSELVRRGLAAVLPAGEPEPGQDLWYELAGFGSKGISVEPGEIDEVVYGL